MKSVRDVFAVLFFVATGFLVSVVHGVPAAEDTLTGTDPSVDSVACEQVPPEPGFQG